MEFISIEQAQKIMQNEDDIMPELTNENNENSTEIKNMMEYIDYVFNISGFMRLNEENELKNNIISV